MENEPEKGKEKEVKHDPEIKEIEKEKGKEKLIKQDSEVGSPTRKESFQKFMRDFGRKFTGKPAHKNRVDVKHEEKAEEKAKRRSRLSWMLKSKTSLKKNRSELDVTNVDNIEDVPSPFDIPRTRTQSQTPAPAPNDESEDSSRRVVRSYSLGVEESDIQITFSLPPKLEKKKMSTTVPTILIQDSGVKDFDNIAEDILVPKQQPEQNKADISRRLSFRLDNRPEKEDLINKGILKPEGSTSEQKTEIIRRLSIRLERRPSAAELQDKNILKMGLDVERSIQAEQVKNNFEERKSALKSILKKRPDISYLENHNILRAGVVDEDFTETISKIRKERSKEQLGNLLDEIDQKVETENPHQESSKDKKIVFHEEVEVVHTFRNSEYSRRPDATSTFLNLNNKVKKQIRQELNTFKREEMAVHELSQNNTVYH